MQRRVSYFFGLEIECRYSLPRPSSLLFKVLADPVYCLLSCVIRAAGKHVAVTVEARRPNYFSIIYRRWFSPPVQPAMHENVETPHDPIIQDWLNVHKGS